MNSPKPQSLTLNASTLSRIATLGDAACDRDQSSPVLSAVSVRIDTTAPQAWCIIVATDGKLLVEERHPVSDCLEGGHHPWLVCEQDRKALTIWLKGQPGLGTITVAEATAFHVTLEGRMGQQIRLRQVQGMFPAYELAFRAKAEPTLVHGVNPEYIARLAKVWPKAILRVELAKGWVCRPLMTLAKGRGVEEQTDGVKRRALVMPCSLPDAMMVPEV